MAEMEKKKTIENKSSGGSSAAVAEKKMSREEKLRKLKLLEEKLRLLEEQKKRTAQQSASDVLDTDDSLTMAVENKIADAAKIAISSGVDRQLESEIRQLEMEIKSAAPKPVKIKDPYKALVEIHGWIAESKYGFMYAIPNNERDIESWKKEWAQVFLDYAKINRIHVLYLNSMITNKPFSDFHDRKKAVKMIAQELVSQGLAKWVGLSFWDKLFKRYNKLRIYWRTIEEWADVIFEWALDNAVFDVTMLMDIRQTDTEFANLPEEDLYQAFKILQSRNKGTLVELEDGSFGFKFKLV